MTAREYWRDRFLKRLENCAVTAALVLFVVVFVIVLASGAGR